MIKLHSLIAYKYMTVLIFGSFHLFIRTYFGKWKLLQLGNVTNWFCLGCGMHTKHKFFDTNTLSNQGKTESLWWLHYQDQLSFHQVFQSSLKCRQFIQECGRGKKTMKKYILQNTISQSIINITLDASVSMNNIQHENVL